PGVGESVAARVLPRYRLGEVGAELVGDGVGVGFVAQRGADTGRRAGHVVVRDAADGGRGGEAVGPGGGAGQQGVRPVVQFGDGPGGVAGLGEGAGVAAPQHERVAEGDVADGASAVVVAVGVA